MTKNSSGLINLIANDREAMDYFKSLSDSIKIQIIRQSEKIETLDKLREEAKSLLKSGV